MYKPLPQKSTLIAVRYQVPALFAEAVSLGLDYLVIGQAVTETENPEAVLDEVTHSIS